MNGDVLYQNQNVIIQQDEPSQQSLGEPSYVNARPTYANTSFKSNLKEEPARTVQKQDTVEAAYEGYSPPSKQDSLYEGLKQNSENQDGHLYAALNKDSEQTALYSSINKKDGRSSKFWRRMQLTWLTFDIIDSLILKFFWDIVLCYTNHM